MKLQKKDPNFELDYVPKTESDRKIWYLELVESQIDGAEQVVKGLQNFVKKLTIEVQGSLQSAAQIKAAAMDLASCANKASDEVDQLRRSVQLVRKDLQGLGQGNEKTMNQQTLNPFLVKTSMSTSAGNDESLENQLRLSSKVRQSLEQEIVNLKMNHQREVEMLRERMQDCDSTMQDHERSKHQLETQVSQLEYKLHQMRRELDDTTAEQSKNQSLIAEKEGQRAAAEKTKQATNKQILKLQTDMREWRKQNEENLREKEKTLEQIREKLRKAETDRDRFKSENQMLRRVDKERGQGFEKVEQLQEENQLLTQNFEQAQEAHRQELDLWVEERTELERQIQQLQVGMPEQNVQDMVKQAKKKSQKKIQKRDEKLKSKDQELEQTTSEIHRLRSLVSLLEQQQREKEQRIRESEENAKYHHQKLKEAELEKDLLLAERNNAIQSNDLSA